MNPNPLSVLRLIVPVVDAISDTFSSPFLFELCNNEYHTFRMRRSGSSARKSRGTTRGRVSVPARRQPSMRERLANCCMPQRACYFAGRFLLAARFCTSVGAMSIGPGRGCFLAMCVERLFVGTCSPQNLQRAVPGEMWTRCIHHQHAWLSPSRQARVGTPLPQTARAACADVPRRLTIFPIRQAPAPIQLRT